MQATKDTFYVTLRDRLVQRDPNLTIVIDGATRPAIVVVENEPPSSLARQNGAFYLEWGGVRSAHFPTSTLAAMDCAITYTSAGQSDSGGVDRGRSLAALDADLLAMCCPAQAHKNDYSTGTAIDLGSYIFWSTPEVKPAKVAGEQVGRQALVTVFFYPEVNQQ
ncbi:MAG TPA: hypothetical protein VMT24_16935 [Aggregatilineaceae bacterium]|nr:hypothetical protein [Aggregatilineaceae bacterium]